MLRIVFMGTPGFSVPPLLALHQKYQILEVWTQPDRPVGRGKQILQTPVKQKALELGLSVSQPEKASVPEAMGRVRQLRPDAIVVVAYGQILKKEFIDIPRLGCINIHSSLLPRWRGAAPIQRAILAGDTKTGVTTMKIVPKLDAGDILLQRATEIKDSDTGGTLHDRLSEMGAALIVETLDLLEKGQITPVLQDESGVTYAEKLTKDMEWLDCSNSVVELSRQIRALDPWPGTSIRMEGGKRLKVRKIILAPSLQVPCGLLDAGRVGDMECLVLGAADGALVLETVQAEGKKAVSGSDFLNGVRSRLPIKVE